MIKTLTKAGRKLKGKSNDYNFTYGKAKDGWRFNFRAPNGEIMFSGEAYVNKSDMLASIKSIQETAGIASVVET